MEYYKLGEKASIFYCPTSRFIIRGSEVVAVTSLPKSKKVGTAKRNGHITIASKEEYEDYLDTLPDNLAAKVAVAQPEAPKDKPSKGKSSKGKKDEEEDLYVYNEELLTLTPDEFRKKLDAESGFLEEDLEKFEKLSDIKLMIKLFDKINKEYAD